MKLALTLLLGLVGGIAVIVFFAWYQPAKNLSDDPYDEIFITINGYMPTSARNWACDELYTRFSGALPPYTCEDVWGPDLP